MVVGDGGRTQQHDTLVSQRAIYWVAAKEGYGCAHVLFRVLPSDAEAMPADVCVSFSINLNLGIRLWRLWILPTTVSEIRDQEHGTVSQSTTTYLQLWQVVRTDHASVPPARSALLISFPHNPISN